MRHRLAAAAALTAISAKDVSGQSAGTPAATPMATPMATPVAADLPIEQIAMLTGPKPSLNNTWDTWEVYGTDLGSTFMYNDEMYIIFGDTFAQYNQDWRSNVAAISTDDDPSDGITFDRMITDREGHAKELLPSKKVDFDEMTVIPTYGIAVGDRLFLHYMSVSHWGEPGHWELGASGYACSDDAGETWTKDDTAMWPGDSNFGQVALEEHDGHIHIFGIPGGRYGGVQHARVTPDALLAIDQYEYWTGSDWSADPAAATIVVPANVGELSVRWNSYYNRWIMMYLNDPAGLIELRTADEITGPWSEPRIAARATEFPALYAPFQFPKWNDGPDIYFSMSMFGPYQVFLMKTSIPDLMP
jgi:hypothetical protein